MQQVSSADHPWTASSQVRMEFTSA